MEPFPRWRVIAIGVLGVVLSGAGWTAAVELQAAQAAAAQAAADRDALVRLVGDRCRAGVVADLRLCQAAQSDARPAQR